MEMSGANPSFSDDKWYKSTVAHCFGLFIALLICLFILYVDHKESFDELIKGYNFIGVAILSLTSSALCLLGLHRLVMFSLATIPLNIQPSSSTILTLFLFFIGLLAIKIKLDVVAILILFVALFAVCYLQKTKSVNNKNPDIQKKIKRVDYFVAEEKSTKSGIRQALSKTLLLYGEIFCDKFICGRNGGVVITVYTNDKSDYKNFVSTYEFKNRHLNVIENGKKITMDEDQCEKISTANKLLALNGGRQFAFALNKPRTQEKFDIAMIEITLIKNKLNKANKERLINEFSCMENANELMAELIYLSIPLKGKGAENDA